MIKISANYIYSPNTGFIKNGILEVNDNGEIIDLRFPSEPLNEEANTKYYNGVICPGFINAHCHIELSHMKGVIPEGLGMANFIKSVISTRQSDVDEIKDAIKLADEEMVNEGIFAVGDISNNEISFSIKKKSSIKYHNFIEIFNLVDDDAEMTFNSGLSLLNKAIIDYGLSASLTPHAPYSVSKKLFDLFRNRLDNPDSILSIHNQESFSEDEFVNEAKGELMEIFKILGMEKGDSKPRKTDALNFLMSSIPQKNPLLLIHNNYSDPVRIESLKLNLAKTYFCLCPNSNLYITGKLPDRNFLRIFPENTCIGTDSLSSNHRLSILEELKTLETHFQLPGLDNLLKMATINGAKALGLENKLGSFEKGKKPGVILLENINLQKLAFNKNTRAKVLIR